MKLPNTDLSVTWAGVLSEMFGGYPVKYHVGSEERFTQELASVPVMISVDPGSPSGVAVWSSDRLRGVSLFEMEPEDLAAALLTHFIKSNGNVAAHTLVCETPLYGAVPVFDPWPWKVRGFLELAEVCHLFVPAEVGWLKPGRHLVAVHTRGISRHAKDALAYGAVALTQSPLAMSTILNAYPATKESSQ